MAIDVQLAIYCATVLLNLTLAVALGATMATIWLARGATAWSTAQLHRVRPVRIGATVAAFAALGILLPLVSASMAEVPVSEAGEAMAAMLGDSHFGMAWTIGMGALALAAVAAALPPPWQSLRTGVGGNLIALAVAFYSRSMVSHAAASGDLSLPVVADWVHLCLIGAWVGGVFVAALVTLSAPVPASASDRAHVGRYIGKLSASATFALAGLVATGVYAAWHNLGSVAGLTSHAYGSVLQLKLALVAMAVLLGGANRFFVMPALLAGLTATHAGAAASLRRFVLILRIEALILFSALIAAALLSATAPPGAT